MRQVLETIDARADTFARLPLFEFLRDDRIDARERLAFAPCIAHFVLTFGDLCAHVLREEPARDRYQEWVNVHAAEDGGHWEWYLSDLEKLGFDRLAPMTETLRNVWGPNAKETRRLSYRLCRLGLGAPSINKLVLLRSVEATFKISLGAASHAVREWSRRTGEELRYFGTHHEGVESQHTMDDGAAERWLKEIALTPETRSSLSHVANEVFDAFELFTDELHRYARSSGEKATSSGRSRLEQVVSLARQLRRSSRS